MRRILTLLLGVLFISVQALAQNTRTITGKITDEKGNPVPNASVLVKGTNLGTTTTTTGSFSLNVPETAKTLVVSSIGMGEKEVAITSASNLNVTLSSSSTNDMQEVVVVAYGQAKKTDITGAVATVKGGDIENKPFTSIDKALQGAVAGLQSVAASGAPGANQQIRIRGISSITASNAPLWVIDGLPVVANDLSQRTTTANILSTLNPNDIESITVLKDASATSIYGSRGANGVILVTTKQGRIGKTKIRFDAEAGQSDMAYKNDKYEPLNAAQYIEFYKEALTNANATQAQINATLANAGFGNGVDYNWLDAVTRRGQQQQYNLSASGGSDKSTFYLSGGYFKQEGTTIATDMERYNAALRVTAKATNRISVNGNVNTGFVQQNTPLSGGAFGNPVLSSYFIQPTRSAFKPDGTYNILTSDFPTSSTFNTVALAYMDKRRLKELSIRGNFSAEIKILENLKVKTSFGGDLSVLEEDQYNNPLYGDGAVLATGSPTFGPNVKYNESTTGRAYSTYTRNWNWVWTNTISYRHNISRDGDIYADAQAGYEAQLNKFYFNNVQGRGLSLSPTLYLQQVSSTSTPSTAQGSLSEYSFISQFGIVKFGYKDRYIVDASIRRDGSSRFSPEHKYGNFWSVGGSWNVDRESFMENLRSISQLKARASYGTSGNAGIGNYDYFPSYSFSTGTSYNSAPGSAPSNVGNPDLTWETVYQLNVGLDVGVFKNRLTLSGDVYNRKSVDLLLNVPLPPTTGFNTQTRNVGSMRNTGVELTLNAIPVTTKNFSWTSNFNFAHNKNRVLEVPAPIIGTFIIQPGYDVQTFYARVYKGVNPVNGDPLWWYDEARTKDTNVLSTAVRVPYGSASPKYFGAFTNTFVFRGFTVEAQFNYQFGNLIQDSWGAYYLGAGFNPGFNKVVRIMDRWQKPGDVTDIPKIISGGNHNFQNFSTFFLNKGDFIRLRNLQVGYQVPANILSRTKVLSSAFVYIRGTNLWTWVGDKNLGFDPEQGVASQTNLDVFIPKTVTLGINLAF